MPDRGLDRRIVLVLALACGVGVANLYYAQPLLDQIGRDLDVSGAVVGLLVTASQIGYAFGLALVVPLGDVLERRALLVRLCLACAVGLAVVAAAPNFGVLAAMLLFVGVACSVAHVSVAAAASLASEHERGRVVGTVMSGLLLGILAARTISGLLADVGGWRLPFVVAAALMALAALSLWRAVPPHRPDAELHYGRLLASVFALIRRHETLRWRMAFGAMGMAGFSVLWTALTFLLAREYGYGEGVIGLFGLFGIAGAASAQLAGRFADRGQDFRAAGAFIAAILASWGLLAFGGSSIAALIAGILLLDLGVQGQQISNQSAIYELDPASRSRITTAYMTSNFLWGAAGSAGASVTYAAGGWSATVVLGAAIACAGMGAWTVAWALGRQPGRVATVES